MVFNFPKVYDILDEFLLGGVMVETSKSMIIARLKECEKLP